MIDDTSSVALRQLLLKGKSWNGTLYSLPLEGKVPEGRMRWKNSKENRLEI